MFLFGRWAAGPLADADEMSTLSGMAEDRAGRQIVVQDDIGAAQPGGSLERQKLGITRTG